MTWLSFFRCDDVRSLYTVVVQTYYGVSGMWCVVSGIDLNRDGASEVVAVLAHRCNHLLNLHGYKHDKS